MGKREFLVPWEEENLLVLGLCVLYRVKSAANGVSIPDRKYDVAVVHHPLVTGGMRDSSLPHSRDTSAQQDEACAHKAKRK